jgi:hypothetical protein
LCAGTWRDLKVAIKTVIFQNSGDGRKAGRIASEAAIASNMQHTNIVATYSHEIKLMAEACQQREHECYKLYLIQVPLLSACYLCACM